MKCLTPELLWHGGANENGKTDPVFSLDLHISAKSLITSGIDASIPPKGSVRFWNVSSMLCSSPSGLPQYYFELNEHASVVNVARFSPCGRLLASASDRQIIVYSVRNVEDWLTLVDTKNIERNILRSSLGEIYDLTWSPDSEYIVAGAIDSKVEMIRVSTKISVPLTGHTNFVQGVAWDPLGQMIVTQSADRTCRVHYLKYKPESPLKLSPKPSTVIKMLGPTTIQNTEPGGFPNTLASASMSPHSPVNSTTTTASPSIGPKTTSSNLFADHTVPSFFRRMDFSPDGSLFVAPCGLLRAPSDGSPFSFCTHVFHRDLLGQPLLSLSGLDEPSVAVRFSPVLYQPLPCPEGTTPLFRGKYRCVFAVATLSTVLVYDTQHFHPIARMAGCHLAAINDLCWSADGLSLCFCSSDGYVTFVRFPDGSLGEPIPASLMPTIVKTLSSQITALASSPSCVMATQPEVVQPNENAREATGVGSAAAGIVKSGPTIDLVPVNSPNAQNALAPTLLPASFTAAEVDQQGGLSSQNRKRRITPSLIAIPSADTGVAVGVAAPICSSSASLSNTSTTGAGERAPSSSSAQAMQSASNSEYGKVVDLTNSPVKKTEGGAGASRALTPSQLPLQGNQGTALSSPILSLFPPSDAASASSGSKPKKRISPQLLHS